MSRPRKRAALDPSKFAEVAQPQPDPVQVATATSAKPKEPARVPKKSAASSFGEADVPRQQPSRVGKVQVMTYVHPDKRKNLKILAAVLGRSQEELLHEAVEELLARHQDLLPR